jgi:hypothetical protein
MAEGLVFLLSKEAVYDGFHGRRPHYSKYGALMTQSSIVVVTLSTAFTRRKEIEDTSRRIFNLLLREKSNRARREPGMSGSGTKRNETW